MTNSLPSNPSINLLKKQAKKLLKKVREGDVSALASVTENYPDPARFASLRDAQLVTARIYGFKGWNELSEAVELAKVAQKNLPDKATLFIQLGCLQYSGNDRLKHYQRARTLLDTYPEIAEFSFYTALVSNNVEAVSNYLKTDSELAVIPGGPLQWPPLLYVVYSRINEPENTQHSISIVKKLLEHGASPDSHVVLNDTYRFTALTGAMGEGEQGVNQPPHQYADQLAALLLSAGANPNEGQGLYNTMFTDSGDKWLALLINNGLTADDPLNWTDSTQENFTKTLDYQLSCAVSDNRKSRVAMLLKAGANPNAVNIYNGRAIHTNALLVGHDDIAQLLQEEGATSEDLDTNDQFKVACVKEDYQTLASLLHAQPDIKNDASLLYAAAENANDSVVMYLLSQGFNVNGQSNHGRTLLHFYALKNDAAQIQALLRLGARTDITDTSHNSNAVGFAAYNGSYDALRVLLDAHGSLLDVVSCANVDRAQAILAENPASINDRTDAGNSVLHIVGSWLHDEPEFEHYQSIIELLVLAGADINAINKNGQTPLQFAIANGLETLSDLLSGNNR